MRRRVGNNTIWLGCGNYKKDGTGCKFSVGAIAGRDLSEEEFKNLITKGRTDVLEGFVAKSKKKFPASLVLQKDEEGRVNITFDFSANEPQIVEGIKCPSCGEILQRLLMGSDAFILTGKKKTAAISQWEKLQRKV